MIRSTISVGPTPASLGAASGTWTAEDDVARAGAGAALRQVDAAPADAPIVLYVPGTSTHEVPQALRDQVALQLGPRAQVVRLGYPATWELRESVATGVAALQTVLDELARRGDDRRVMLVGESQGAWVIGEVMRQPGRAAHVDRAVLLGHPALARTHYVDGDLPWAAASKVVEIANDADTVPREIDADPNAVLDAISRLGQGDLGGLLSAVRVVASDPGYGLDAGINALRGSILDGRVDDPHDYSGRMREAVALLRSDPSITAITVD